LLTLPVLLVHGTRGDFTDYSHKNDVMEKANWRSVVLKSGALPHFERPREFFDACDMFLDELGSARAGPTVTTDGAASRATTRPSH
jgi:pimeloyl-ACP methyl ester carboxylesterase